MNNHLWLNLCEAIKSGLTNHGLALEVNQVLMYQPRPSFKEEAGLNCAFDYL